MFLLMYKDIPVLKFKEFELSVLHKHLLPVSIQHLPEDYSMIQHFCNSRCMQMNRGYAKEILTSCGIEQQNDVSICTLSLGLSFRDNYWIKSEDDTRTWKDVNLYSNEFSKEISRTSLTGEMCSVTLSDKVYTGELTNLGTRAKSFVRMDGKIYLLKSMPAVSVMHEVVAYYVAEALGVECTKYGVMKYSDLLCSVCEIETSMSVELTHAEDYRSRNLHDVWKTNLEFLDMDRRGYMLMQIFDYLTLNTDRNFKNFAMKRVSGREVSLYKLYDHDACFLGVTDQGIYFPTALSFWESMLWLNENCHAEFQRALTNVERFRTISQTEEWKDRFCKYGRPYYKDLCARAEKLLTLHDRLTSSVFNKSSVSGE